MWALCDCGREIPRGTKYGWCAFCRSKHKVEEFATKCEKCGHPYGPPIRLIKDGAGVVDYGKVDTKHECKG